MTNAQHKQPTAFGCKQALALRPGVWMWQARIITADHTILAHGNEIDRPEIGQSAYTDISSCVSLIYSGKQGRTDALHVVSYQA